MLRIRGSMFLALFVTAANPLANESDSYPTVSVQDVVSQAVIGDPMSTTWNDFAARISTTSPDGAHVAVVVRRGNPKDYTNDAELLVYPTARVFGEVEPRVMAKFASATNYQPIALVQWLADSHKLVFAATRGNENSQVFQADLRTGEMKQLTQLQSPLRWYGVTASGDRLATISEPLATPSKDDDPQCLQQGCLVTAETLRAAQQGLGDKSAPVTVYELRTSSRRTFAPPEATDSNLMNCFDELTGGLSPDGRFGLRICRFRAHHWPSWWGDYSTYPGMELALKQGATGYLRQWILYDFERHTTAKLTVAPYFMGHYASKSRPLWIDNGRHIIIAGALEPLLDVDAVEWERRANHYSVLLVDPATHRTQRIAELDSKVLSVTGASWDDRTNTLTVESMDAARRELPRLTYRRRADGRWIRVRDQAQVTSVQRMTSVSPELLIRQSPNDPPVLVAKNRLTGTTNTLMNPNPWLAERKLGRIETTSWRSKDRREWKGGLLYPANYQQGVRYPLVLQTHGFEENSFSLSGAARVFAAQPLAGLDIMVLQVAENTDGLDEVDEWPAVQAGYESAIDHLDALGLIDRSRVGIQGWSRSGSYAGYTLTHSSHQFAAGAFTVSADFGWWWYLLQGARHGETEYGVSPFSREGLDVWQTMSPSFNLYRVNAPMLMCSDAVTGMWDWYVGLRRLEKPVEYWSYPGITHDVFKVSERLSINQLVVDWFRFWLKGEEDPTLGKEEQYMRWRTLREQQSTITDFRSQISAVP